MKKILAVFIGTMILLLDPADIFAQDSNVARLVPQFQNMLNPSNWLQHGQNTIIQFESDLANDIDTSFMNQKLDRLVKDNELIKNDFESHGKVMRIRTLDDVKAKLLQQKSEIDKWRNTIRKQNDLITANYFSIEKLKTDSMWNALRTDSSLWAIYEPEFRIMESEVRRIEFQFQDVLKKTVAIESRLNSYNINISELILQVDKELAQRSSALFHRTHAPFWELTSDTYSESIGTVFLNTVKQNLDSLKFYGKNAYIRVILFRILLLFITLLPIWYFKKNKKRLEPIDTNQSYKFVHKYTGASTSSFVLVMAPLIFVNSPHIFTEVIFVTLSITTTLIFLKEQPGLKRKWLYALLAIYIILKAMNLMVSVTLFGRVVWTLSIIGLVPLYYVYKSINKTTLSNKLMFQVVLALTSALYIAGWILNFTGHYPLGRILLLAGLDQFFLAIILYVAIYSLIDFIAILANIYNHQSHNTSIRVELIYFKLLKLVRLLALLFWFSNFLLNINASDFLKHNVFSLLNEKFTVAGYNYAPGSIIIFFATLYLSVFLSGMLDGLFLDEKRSEESSNKTSLGSIVILLRLFIIASGFLLGMVIAGIPLNNLSLFVGALGVGIGFGLQSIIANMISGIIIAFEKPVYVGDIIEIEKGTRGRVTDIGLRATTVDTADGAEYIIPNNEMIGKVLKNWTLTSKDFKMEINFQTDHENDPELIRNIATNVLGKTPGVLSHPEPTIRLNDINSRGLTFVISCWIRSIIDSRKVTSDILEQLHGDLLKAGITYPQPFKQD